MANARVSGAPVSLKGTRIFRAEAGAEDIEKTMKGKWDATLWSASGSLAYDTRVGGLTLRPMVAVAYLQLQDDGYPATGGGEAFDPTFLSRDRAEIDVSGPMRRGPTGRAPCRERVGPDV